MSLKEEIKKAFGDAIKKSLLLCQAFVILKRKEKERCSGSYRQAVDCFMYLLVSWIHGKIIHLVSISQVSPKITSSHGFYFSLQMNIKYKNIRSQDIHCKTYDYKSLFGIKLFSLFYKGLHIFRDPTFGWKRNLKFQNSYSLLKP